MKILLNPKIDLYLKNGCGRCKYYMTPKCKVNTWRDILEELRQIALQTGLKEELKWGVPVYTHEDKNIVIVSAFKDYASIGFFKGALLNDKMKILIKQGASSQSSRIIKFTESSEVRQYKSTIKEYIKEAITIEKEGKKVEFKKNLEPVPEELTEMFKKYSSLEKAFYALTPGKQRGYIIYFSQPKHSITRLSRIESQMEKILRGVGFHDTYKKGK